MAIIQTQRLNIFLHTKQTFRYETPFTTRFLHERFSCAAALHTGNTATAATGAAPLYTGTHSHKRSPATPAHHARKLNPFLFPPRANKDSTNAARRYWHSCLQRVRFVCAGMINLHPLTANNPHPLAPWCRRGSLIARLSFFRVCCQRIRIASICNPRPPFANNSPPSALFPFSLPDRQAPNRIFSTSRTPVCQTLTPQKRESGSSETSKPLAAAWGAQHVEATAGIRHATRGLRRRGQ